jgi:SAM-dependent methyltransferase
MSARDTDVRPSHRPREQQYDAAYYAHYFSGGDRVAYERNEQWLGFFGTVAARIAADIAPASALDVGCAHGFLVEALRDRGVDAKGFDVSDFAISQVREDVRPHCWVGSALDPIRGHYDLVTCIEVLEHLEEKDADLAVGNICAVTDDVIFTSTPTDYREETHVNVRPPEYWAGLFARHGFARDLGFDGSFLAWWGMRFRRTRDPWHRLAVDYEREWWRLKQEARERNSVVLSQLDRQNELEGRLEALAASNQVATARVTEVEEALQERVDQLIEKDREVQEMGKVVAAYEGSSAFRITRGIRSVLRRAVPGASRRHRPFKGDARGPEGERDPESDAAPK